MHWREAAVLECWSCIRIQLLYWHTADVFSNSFIIIMIQLLCMIQLYCHAKAVLACCICILMLQQNDATAVLACCIYLCIFMYSCIGMLQLYWQATVVLASYICNIMVQLFWHGTCVLAWCNCIVMLQLYWLAVSVLTWSSCIGMQQLYWHATAVLACYILELVRPAATDLRASV